MRRSLRRKGGRCGEGGQAIVESALVLPLYVFLMLGTIQIGLMHQARLLTKYAAYRATRAGALYENDPKQMEMAALTVLLPMFAFQPAFFSEAPKHFVIRRNPDENDFTAAARYSTAYTLLTGAAWSGFEVPPADVTICGPGTDDISGRVDFDDPEIAAGQEWHSGNKAEFDSKSWRAFQATKLRVQVTFNYRMPIPFANRIIAQLFLGQEINRVLMMDHLYNQVAPGLGRFEGLGDALWGRLEDLLRSFQNREYVLPIRANYNMRMMSNINPDHDLPKSVDKSECFPWTA